MGVSPHLHNTLDNFEAGKIRFYLGTWKYLTSDRRILNSIKGVSVSFPNDIEQHKCLLIKSKNEIAFSEGERMEVRCIIGEFLRKKIIQTVTERQKSFSVISNIFLRPKPDGSKRLILNLKNFNEVINKQHFKMDTLHSVLKLIHKDCFFAKLDIRDAYYSINIQEKERKFFRFYFDGILYEFCALPQGYRDAPRLFTKILKVPLTHLRSQGHINVGYLDDIYLQGDTYQECRTNVLETASTLDKLGFTVHEIKSIMIPHQIMEFLGFVLNSQEMIVSPTMKKSQKIRNLCENILKAKLITLRNLAELIGHLVAIGPGNRYAPIFYKRLEILRNNYLKISKGDYEVSISFSNEVKDDISWWIKNVDKYPNYIGVIDFSLEMYTDASLTGYGIYCNGQKTCGLWNASEKQLHINVLELLAVKFGLFCFCNDIVSKHVHLFSDSSVAVSGINKMGSCKAKLNEIIREVWEFCIQRNLKLTASHIPGIENSIADELSRKHKTELEWKLNPGIFELLSKRFGPFDMDLFASRVNFQLKPYVSWNPDPEAMFINAFHMKWTKHYGYAFPPFSLIGRIIQKLEMEEAEVCLVLPWWKTQSWFPKLGRLLIESPLLIPNRRQTLLHPLDPSRVHPLHKKLNLVVCKLSGKVWKQKEFLRKQQILSWPPGERELQDNMKHTRNSSLNFVVKGTLIHVLPLQG